MAEKQVEWGKITKEMFNAHTTMGKIGIIALLILVGIEFLLPLYGSIYFVSYSYLFVFIFLFYLITLVPSVITILYIMVNYYISRYFKPFSNEFTIRFSRGFKLLFISATLHLILGSLTFIYNNSFIIFHYVMLGHNDMYQQLFQIMTLTLSTVFSLIGLYGGYLLVSALKFYRPHAPEVDASQPIAKDLPQQ